MANNRIQVKRTSTSGRTPNTTNSGNSQYIAAGEFALNMADGILYTSNGSASIEIGANNTNQNVTGNLTVKAIIANNSIGAAGQTLTSNGSAVYWATGGGSGTVTQVDTGSGLTGGPITTTGTVSILANTGIVANSTGTFVNAAYIGTLTANNANNLDGVAATSYVNTSGNYTLSGNLTFTSGANAIVLSNATSNWVYWDASGATPPTFTTRSAGTKLVLYPALSDVQADYALGIEAATLWSSVPVSSDSFKFKWYGGTTEAASLSGAGQLTVLGSVNAAAYNVGTSFTANSTVVNAVSYYAGTLLVANTTVSNATHLGGTAASGYQTSAGLSANVATLTANNSTNLNGQPASFYTNASNITTGALPYAQIPANIVNTTAAFTISGVRTHNANIVIGTTAGISANGGFGTAGHVLHSNGTSVYWAVDDNSGGTVTSVATGNGMTGGAITTTGTVSVLANTGIVANATGTFVNASYIATITANNATFINGNSVLTVMESLRANRALHGGGTITVSASGDILWSARFIVISNGRGTHFSTDGFFNISCPTSGTITGVGGAANKTATAAGIPLGSWEAIYYIMPIGSNSGSLAANFRVVSYTSDVEIPSNWLLICVKNDDNSNYYFNNGIILKAGQSFAGGTFTSANMPLANNATNLNGQAASFYTNASNITTGTLPDARLSSAVINTTAAFTRTGVTTFSANVILNSSGLSANGGFGTAGQVLTTNGTATYWTAAAGGGYYKGGSAAVGTLAVGGQNLFRVNADTLNFNTTIAAGENAQATGPIAVAAGITLTVASGARVAIV